MLAESSDYLDWKEWRAEQFGHFSALDASYFSAETAVDRGATPRVLEIGFGNGAFLGWMHSCGIEAFGVEQDVGLVLRAKQLLGEERAFNSLDDARLARFDHSFSHVVAFDVIEHIPESELPVYFARMGRLLRPQGRIIVRFPNGDSPFGRINQHGDPTHVTTLGRGKLEYLARRAGFEIETLRAPVQPTAGVGLRRAIRRGLVKLGRAGFERLVSLLYFGGRPIPLDPNYTAILRVRER